MQMPAWNTGELPDAPRWSGKKWASLIGPGLLSAGAAIGGGEWLMGPVVTAKYGGAILWVTTLSILGQVVYNIEISRYTLYTGEPVMIGKFRTLPGPLFWLFVYLLLDFSAVFPYQAASAATPAASIVNGQLPDPQNVASDKTLLWILACVLFLLTAVPLVLPGKIYTVIKWIMTFKVVTVFSFLLFMVFLYTSAPTWLQIASGFLQFGSVPVEGGRTENLFVALFSGGGFPKLDTTAIGALAAYAAIAGIGGLKNMTISNYTRDQGWGMGAQVGAIPSIFGGRAIELSHVGTVFPVTDDSLPRWRRWIAHVSREQWAIWAVGSLVGVALPAMLSVEFIPRGKEAGDWAMAGMVADGVQARMGGILGSLYWYMLMICGLLILLPNTCADADGSVRRWVDLFWTSSQKLRAWNPKDINRLYFFVLAAYLVLGLVLLSITRPRGLITVYGCIANFALGFSCWHALAVNLTLLPPELRPRWTSRIAMVLSGAYFFFLAALTSLSALGWI